MTNDNKREELIEQATWLLIDYDTDVVDRGVSDEHYRERRAEVERVWAVFEKAHAPTDDEREEALHLIEQAESFREQMSVDVDAFPNSMVGLWLRTASALESALRRSEVPEPQGEPSDAQRASTAER